MSNRPGCYRMELIVSVPMPIMPKSAAIYTTIFNVIYNE